MADPTAGFVASLPGAVRRTTADLVSFVREVLDPIDVHVHEDRVAFGWGTPVAHVIPRKDHVILRFAHAAPLNDPNGALEPDGDGGVVRLERFGDLDHERAVLWLNQIERLQRA